MLQGGDSPVEEQPVPASNCLIEEMRQLLRHRFLRIVSTIKLHLEGGRSWGQRKVSIIPKASLLGPREATCSVGLPPSISYPDWGQPHFTHQAGQGPRLSPSSLVNDTLPH